MKIWLKYLLGCLLGSAFYFLITIDNPSVLSVISLIAQFSIRAGKFALLPLLFFTMTVSVCSLREEHLLFKTALNTVIITVLSTLVFVALGVASVLIAQAPRIPISVEDASGTYTLSVVDNLFKLVPESNFETFLDGKFILPLLVLAGFAGAGCATDKAGAKPMLTLFESIAKVSYAVVCFFIDMFAIGLIAVSFVWFLDFARVFSSPSLFKFVLIIAVDACFIIFVLYPLILKARFKERHPYRCLYASLAPLFTAFFTADYNMSLAVSLRHTKESLGVDSKINTVTMPVFSVFARGGSALILAASFIVILKSYSDMSIMRDLVWIIGMSFVLSFLLGALPTGSTIVALALMCSLYGRGFENGYLIIKPAAFVLCSLATLIDTSTMIFGTYYIALRQKMQHPREVRFYI